MQFRTKECNKLMLACMTTLYLNFLIIRFVKRDNSRRWQDLFLVSDPQIHPCKQDTLKMLCQNQTMSQGC